MDKINIPDSYDPEWQSEQLRIIAHHLDNVMGDYASEDLSVIYNHIEALRQYSGY